MQAFPTASARSGWLLGLFTPLAIAIVVVVLLMMPNLIMHVGPIGYDGRVASDIDHHATSQSAAAGTAPSVVR